MPSQKDVDDNDVENFGRPRHLSLKLTDEELAAFKKKAEETGSSLATWARAVMRRAAGLPTP